MSPKNYLTILRGGIILSLSFVLLVFPSLLFPYISSKQLVFNILMEVLFAVWLVFIWRYKSYRPKMSLMIYGLLAYLAVILVSSFTGVDFNLSFWGDVERMLGFFHIFHFLIFFFILITAFRSGRDYKLLLLTSVVVATLVSLNGLLGENRHTTLGNTTYVSGYIIFNLFFSAILFFRSKSHWRYLYLAPIIIMLLQFKNMRTSGAIIGLAAGIFVAIVLIGLLHDNKKIRYWFLSLAALSLITVAFIFSQQNATWFQNSFLKNLTGQKVTFQTRLLSWQSAAQDFSNHPILGTGFGNYAITFDKHFQPEFLNFDRNETYFDRAHNNLIDIASTTGILGLLTYLSIFVFLFITIYKLWKNNGKRINNEYGGRHNLELVILVSLIVAYFIQNLAVFDSFVTYMGLMMTLGYVYFLSHQENYLNTDNNNTSSVLSGGREGYALVGLLILMSIFTYQTNIKTWQMLKGVITGYSQIVNENVETGFDTFRASFNGSPLERDGRSSLINLITSNPVILADLGSQEKILSEYEYIVSLVEKNLAYNPNDSLTLLQLSQVYDIGARIFSDDEELSMKYANLSLEYAEKAIESSPGRVPVYFSKAQALLQTGDTDKALEVLEYAADLNPDYPDSYCRLSQIYLEGENEEKKSEAINKCIDGGAVNRIGGVNFLIAVASYLAENEDYERAVLVMERLIVLYDKDPNMWMNLAKLYMLTDAPDEKVRQAANQAVILDSSFIPQAESLFE